jgi:hypothetical protein
MVLEIIDLLLDDVADRVQPHRSHIRSMWRYRYDDSWRVTWWHLLVEWPILRIDASPEGINISKYMLPNIQWESYHIFCARGYKSSIDDKTARREADEVFKTKKEAIQAAKQSIKKQKDGK